MDLALLWFGFLWAWLGRGRHGGGSTTPETSPPSLPSSRPPEALPPAAPPWPQVMPTGLPPFPGSGWEYDEPPPAGVVARARALLSELWAKGRGAWRAEKTDGRWIVYRAEITRGNKRGVVAYRERSSTTTRAPSAPSAPSSPSAPASAPGFIPVAIEPGAPAPSAVIRSVVVGRIYRFRMQLISSDSGASFTPDMLAGAAKGLALMGAFEIEIEPGPPPVLAYSMKAVRALQLPLNTPLRIRTEEPPMGLTIVVLSVDDITPSGSNVTLPTLRRGAGIRPQQPSADVRLLQGKLGIPVDGQFGAGTEQAVKAFQRSKGLTPDGIVGAKTWTALFAAHRA